MSFSTIGLMGKPGNPEVKSTFHYLIEVLTEANYTPKVDEACHSLIDDLKNIEILPANQLAKSCDLIIVVGGDGSLLNAARAVVDTQIPVIGVNRGRKGFLTDISPQALGQYLIPMLQGQHLEEQRFLLQAKVLRKNKVVAENIALNDAVVYSGHVARMIELEVTIDKAFVYRERSDGLIICTPTGSTAYALSGGGPILYPTLDAVALVPMHPHTLSSRPIVVDSQSTIEVYVTEENQFNPRLSWDGQVHADVQPHDRVVIERYHKPLKLLHPQDYDYFQTLRSKLGWHLFQ